MLALVAVTVAAQAPIGGQPGTPGLARSTPRVEPIPTSTPNPGTQPAPARPPAPGQPSQPTQPGPATPSWTPLVTATPIPTWTPLPTPTVTNTATASPYPTFLPQVTPTLAWPTPAPGAYFRSRYMAVVPDPSIPLRSGAGVLRGRIVDWRGIGLDRFRVQAVSDHGQMETATLGDGGYSFQDVPPGQYEVGLPDYPSEPARAIPVLSGRATTLDWQESNRVEGVPVVVTPTVVSPSATPSPVPAQLIQRPPSSPARPPPVEVVAIGIVARAAETLANAFVTGLAIVAVAAAITLALIRWRRSA